MKHTILLTGLLALCQLVNGQETIPVNGVHDDRTVYHAFTNATIHASPEVQLDSATLLIKEGRVVEVGASVTLPPGTVVHPCHGTHIYPSFIDPYAGFHISKKDKNQHVNQTASTANHWNPAVRPERVFEPTFPIDQKTQDDWLASGIGVVGMHERDGIFRGSGAAILMGIDQANLSVISSAATHHYSLDKGTSKDDYPSSHVGAVALVRQTLYDAQWYANASQKEEVNRSLKALSEPTSGQHVFELNHELSYRNVQSLGAEFGRSFALKGVGKEYLVADRITPGTQVIAPVSLPKPLDVSDPFDARMASLQQLKHWEAAPFNPLFLQQQGHVVSLTRDTIKKHKEYLHDLHRIAETGLSHEQLLRMLTIHPAKLLGISDVTGSLSPGKQANFFLSQDVLGSSRFMVVEHWNLGQKVFSKPLLNEAFTGTYNLVIDGADYVLTLKKGEKGVAPKLEPKASDRSYDVTADIQSELITLVIYETVDKKRQLRYRLSGKFSLGGTLIDGKGEDVNGRWVEWAGVKDRNKQPQQAAHPQRDSTVSPPTLWHPNMAYGWDSLKNERSFVVTNAVIWTAADTGKLDLADLWVENGKIKAIGSGMLYPERLKRIDAKGRHITPGIIDEHSHIALRGGVNEWARASSSEVRMSDAVDPWSIHIYRQLAGGVTAAQLLHGSANPIGGQSALIKLKWGKPAEEMLIEGADGFIKFALGENVKRSNRKDPKGRFPLTRMGVEQTFVDAFTRAGEYRKPPLSLSPSKTSKNGPQISPQRRDLQLDALVEILDSKRFISCHSYVQSEVLMLMNVADSFGFKVNTFTHILEGYKVAEELAEHGASGSTFSDWWAYKFEVNDAIPYNAAMMTRVGVNTGINSDDAEMGRRLNQEAAKTMKYGGMSASEALRMITINPAKMLHLDDRIGSLEVGKDADFVIWSGHPLSVYSHAEQTFIEGVKYFDVEEMKQRKERMERERARLTEAMLQSKSERKQHIKPKKEKEYHCDTLLENYLEE